MPRKRKYDYQKDYPVRKAIYIRLTVEQVRILEEIGYDSSKLSDLVEKYLVKIVEKHTKKG